MQTIADLKALALKHGKIAAQVNGRQTDFTHVHALGWMETGVKGPQSDDRMVDLLNDGTRFAPVAS